MLLVHHDQAEPPEANALLDEGMGADDAADGALRRRGDQRGSRLALHRIGEERHLHPERPEQPAERQQMLLGEDLGRRHERRLIARFDRRQHGQRGDDRLARADVTLEQAIHRVRLRHVGPDLAPDPLLGAGERERQGLAQPPGQRALGLHAEAALAALALAANGEAELEQEEVIEDEAPARRFLLGGRLGKMTGLERRRDVEEPPPPANSLRKRLLNEVAVAVEEPLDEGAERALREPLREAVDRNEAAGV